MHGFLVAFSWTEASRTRTSAVVKTLIPGLASVKFEDKDYHSKKAKNFDFQSLLPPSGFSGSCWV
ncbi:hypothetical protein CVT26_005224, partial [Gymnopilus dilepis]